MRLLVKEGNILNLPVYEPSKNGKNWFAVITTNGAGKIDRRFIDKAPGDVLKYPAASLQVGDMLEFGADILKGKDRQPRRWYGIVIAKTDTDITATEYPTIEKMVEKTLAPQGAPKPKEPKKQEAAAAAAPELDQKGLKESLKAEKNRLLHRLGEIEFELHKLSAK